MRTTATTLAAMLAVALAALPAFAQETTIKVPQGSGVFPTVGQVNCLEEMATVGNRPCGGGVNLDAAGL